jgi:hypothetical protein
MRMSNVALRRSLPALGVACLCALAATAAGAGQDKQQPKKAKPSITVRATPSVGFAPARFVLTAEIVGGADDYEEFYCAGIEWDFGDDTRSESKQDCDPYEAGKSEIKRRFVMDRTFNVPGEFRVEFRLKQKNKTVAVGRTEVKVRCGARDNGDYPCR